MPANGMDFEPKRLTFAYFTEGPLDEALEFTHWPQHLTLFPPVKAAPFTGRIVAEQVANSAYEFPITIESEEVFDGEKVHLLDERSEMIANLIHMRLLEGLMGQNVDMAGQQFIGKDRIPHITQKEGHKIIQLGDELWVNHIAVLARDLDDNDQPVGPQRVHKVYDLKPRG